jgi:hypothetical protein
MCFIFRLLLVVVKRIWKKAISSLFQCCVHLFDGDNELFFWGGFCLLIVFVCR